MELNKELEKLKACMDANLEDDYKKQSDYIYSNFTSETDIKTIDSFISGLLSELSSQTKELIVEAESILVREQLKEVSEIISLSYIARKYFNKNRTWIYQKINGNLKNGKSAKFTSSEIQMFNFALKDIGNKIGSIAINP